MPQSQSNLDSCISDPTIGEVHKLVTYYVTTPRQGSLLRFLCWLPFPRPSFIPVRPIASSSLSLSFPSLRRPLTFSIHTRGTGLVSYSYKAAPKSFRVNGATVKNIQKQLLSLTDSFNVPAKGGVKAASIYLDPVPGCRCSFRDLFIAWLGPLSSSTIPYGPRDRSFLRFYLRTV